LRVERVSEGLLNHLGVGGGFCINEAVTSNMSGIVLDESA
jgi:hypothetical protein